MPNSPLSADLYILLAVSPMLLWDLARNRYLHRAWWIWLALLLPAGVLTNMLWNTAWWHNAARTLMGV